ncbi:MAG: ABC transporter ATP-binding protein [Clostridia bacterium]|nr:ABC transporter ATP-binding protein [Clostridia bacterium]
MTSLRHIEKSFGGKAVLRDVSLDIPAGVTCLMGVSGSGKTTLLRILLGLETPDGGAVENRPARMAVLFQEDRLVEPLTVRANLRLALGEAFDAAKAEACLVSLGLTGALGLTVSTLSGGMKRRVALCRALLCDAPLLVLDEPFKGLDEENRLRAIDAVRADSLRRPALVVTHDARECDLLGGRVIRLGEGR